MVHLSLKAAVKFANTAASWGKSFVVVWFSNRRTPYPSYRRDAIPEWGGDADVFLRFSHEKRKKTSASPVLDAPS
jgi:hypothetical protein